MNNSPTVNYYSASDSGLVAFWNFNETAGDTVFDLTRNNYFGIIHGAVRSEEASPLAIEKNYNTRVLPDSWTLNQNYPNPFNPLTKIRFTIPQTEKVKIQIFNSVGQLVETLFENELKAGLHEVEFSAYSLPSGLYFYRLQAGHYMNTRKMLLIR
jgi:hypothetical protein